MQKLPLGGGDTLDNLNTQPSNTSIEKTPQPPTKTNDKSGFTLGIEANLEAMILLCKAIVQAILLTTLLPQTISPLMEE